jgi:hypothetical protein
MLRFAAVSDVLGASLDEPCRQMDQIGKSLRDDGYQSAYGRRDDNIEELSIVESMGLPQGFGEPAP